MRYTLLLLILLLGGCFFNPDSGAPSGETIPTPRLETPDDKGKVSYSPSEPRQVDDPETQESVEETEHCDVEDYTYDVDPKLIESHEIGFAYDTVEFSRNVETTTRLRRADHVHLKGVRFLAVAGDTFQFLSWIQVYLKGHKVAWGRDLNTDNTIIHLQVDGSKDFAEALKTGVTLTGSLRAKSPDVDTYVGAKLDFLLFDNCEWY